MSTPAGDEAGTVSSDRGLHVLLDRQSLQSRAHLCIEERDRSLEPGQRLRHFRNALEAAVPCTMFFSEGEALTRQSLVGADVLVIPTRDVRLSREDLDAPFAHEELAALERFVANGGGLLLMSNHPPFTNHDRVLAERFGVEVEETYFRESGQNERITFSGGCLLTGHPIISGGEDGQEVKTVVINNGTSLNADPDCVVVRYPAGVGDGSSQVEGSEGRAFAIAIPEGRGHGDGRVVVMGDSGFMGSDDTSYPGPGLFRRGNNRSLLVNTVRWVGGTIGGTDG